MQIMILMSLSKVISAFSHFLKLHIHWSASFVIPEVGNLFTTSDSDQSHIRRAFFG